MGIEPASTVALAPSYVGILSDSAGGAVAVVSSLRHGRLLSIKLLKPLAIGPGQVARLWALPSDGRQAFPVDLLPSAQKKTIELPSTSDKIFSNVARLAVSIESLSVQSVNSPPDTYHLWGPCVKLW
jgi:anti-sigma-K factor RskA